jgi:DNA-binding FrmR family transcriptional regulator
MASLFHERALAMARLEKIEGQIKDLRRMIGNGSEDCDILEKLREEHQAIDKVIGTFRERHRENFITHPENCSCML